MSRTLLSCLALGLGAAACATGVLPVGTVAGSFAGSVVGGIAGNLATDLFKALDRRVAERFFDGRSGIDENHHVDRALRLAHVNALRAILKRFDQTRATDFEPARRAQAERFSAALAEFLKNEFSAASTSEFATGADDEQTVRLVVLRALPEVFDRSLAARRATGDRQAMVESVGRLRSAVEAAVLEEVRKRTLVEHEPFPTLFLSAFEGSGFPDGWFDLFVRDAAAKIKEDDAFERVWNAEQLALTKALAEAHTAVLDRIDQRTAEIDEATKRIEDGLLDRDPGPIVPNRGEARSSSEAVVSRGRPTFAPIKFPHQTGLYAATFAPSGRSIVVALKRGIERKSSGQGDNVGSRAFVWNVDDPKPSDRKAERAHHENGIVYAVFSPDGSRIATASEDGTAKIWYSGEKGLAVGKHLHHGETVNTAHFSPDGLRIVTASWDGTAAIWDAYAGVLERKLNHRSGPEDDDVVNSAFFSPRGNEVLTAAYYGTARIWDADTGEVVRSFTGRHRALCSASYSLDGKLIVTSDAENGTSYVWDAAVGSVVSALGGRDRHKASVWSAAFSYGGDKVVTASADFKVLVWDVATGNVLVRMDHPAPVITAYFSPDDSRILTACDDGYAYLWQIT